jgi:hypothetical protein
VASYKSTNLIVGPPTINSKEIISDPDSDHIIYNSNFELKIDDKIPVTNPNTEYYHNSYMQISKGYINNNITMLCVK